MKKSIKTTLGLAACLAVSLALPSNTQAATQTAQSAMVATTLDSANYQIDGTITWTYDKDCAATHYQLVVTGPVAIRTKGTCAQPATPAQPSAPSSAAGQLNSHLAQEACTFFCGGILTSANPLTQTVTIKSGSGNSACWWDFTWSYTWEPVVANEEVAPKTCWTSEETGGTVDVGFEGFVASESYMKNGTKTKYSFTLLESGLTRVLGVTAQLQLWDVDANAWANVGGSVDLNNVDTDADTVNDGLAVSSTIDDYLYSGNAGVFGNGAVYGALHAPGYAAAAGVDAILISDNFANNNNDRTSGNVHQADYSGSFPGLTEAGTYQIVVSGTIKGNSATVGQAFSVASNMITIGGCDPCP